MRKIFAIIITLVALTTSSTFAATSSEKEAMVGVAEALVALSLMTGDVDVAVANATTALDIATAAKAEELTTRSKKLIHAYRAIGAMTTGLVAENKGEGLEGAHALKSFACVIAESAAKDNEMVAEKLAKVHELCTSIARVGVSDEAKRDLLQVAGILLSDASAFQKGGMTSGAIGYAIGALDIANLVGEKELAQRIESVLVAYRAISLAEVAEVFKNEGNVQAATGLKELTCSMTGDVASELGAMLEKTKQTACGTSV